MTQLSMSTGNRVHAVTERGNDLYETPECAVQALLALEDIPQVVWEPACGPGAIVRVLRGAGRTVRATDLVDYGCPMSRARIDFLLEREPQAECIVTNPPFKNAEEFAAHAMELCEESYLLMRVAFLEGLRWYEAGRGAKGLANHLRHVWVFAPRLPMMHRAGWDGPINSNSGMAFAWFCFRKDHGQTPTIGWVNPRMHVLASN